MIEFKCSECGRGLKAAEERAGEKGRCPSCGSLFAIPGLPPEPPAAAHGATDRQPETGNEGEITAEARIEKLEEQVARVRRFNRWLTGALALVAVAWVVAEVLGLAVGGEGAGRASEAETTAEWAAGAGVEEVRARQFILEDENGEPRAWLVVEGDGSSLILGHENGGPRALLKVDKHGPALHLFDENGQARARLAGSRDGYGLTLSDGSGEPRAWLKVDKDGLVSDSAPDVSQVLGKRLERCESEIDSLRQRLAQAEAGLGGALRTRVRRCESDIGSLREELVRAKADFDETGVALLAACAMVGQKFAQVEAGLGAVRREVESQPGGTGMPFGWLPMPRQPLRNCSSCDATGYADVCSRCRGTGVKVSGPFRSKCDRCAGRGFDRCGVCGGDGVQ